MLSGSNIAVIVPAYNEAARIAETLRGIPPFVDRIYVVDDASIDDTHQRVQALRDPRVTILRHERNAGVGAALQTGYRTAFRENCEVAVVMAGDGQMDPADLTNLLAPVLNGRAGYAKGNRLQFPDARRLMPFWRWLGNHVLSRFTSWSTGITTRDSQCGYTAITKEAARRVDLTNLWPRYGYPNDLLARLSRARVSVEEVVVRPVYRGEKSGIGIRHALFVIPYLLLRGLVARLRTQASPQLTAPSQDDAQLVSDQMPCE